MDDQRDPTSPATSFTVRFPSQDGRIAGEEVFEVAFPGGATERMRIHDYARVYALPGLYEEVVQRRLDCRAPATVAGALAAAARELGRAPEDVRVLDVGAGNGVSGEALAARGLRPVAAVDILPEAREAALRDRPGLYEVYLAADLTALEPREAAALRALRPNALALVGAVGGGHLPVAALEAAFGLVEPGALFAVVLDPALPDDDARGFAALLAELERAGRLAVLRRERYRHRLTAGGGEREGEVVVARLRA